jgi:hypothetical protein
VRQSKGLYVLALIQLLVASGATWQWLQTGDGLDLFWAVIFGLLAIILAVTRYRVRNTPALAKSDPRVLRRIARVGGVTGTLALIALFWRVQGEWIRLGETTNLVLALFCIFGFVCAAFGALFLMEQREP